MSIKPTVGRVLLYRPLEEDDETIRQAAIVTTVHSDECVNLAVFNGIGEAYHRQSVVLVQDPDEAPEAGQCEWMEYQKGQAAKVDDVAIGVGEVLAEFIKSATDDFSAVDDFMEQTADRINALNERVLALEDMQNIVVSTVTDEPPSVNVLADTEDDLDTGADLDPDTTTPDEDGTGKQE